MMLSTIVATDWWFENVLLSVRTPFLVRLFEGITFFGNPVTVAILVLLLALFLAFSNRFRPYLRTMSIIFSGAAVSGFFLKELIARARPDGPIPALVQSGFSFPSGHATASMILYGFVAYVLCREYPRYASLLTTLAVISIMLIGFSRLYLGVHFPSDVIGGYALGGLWLLIGIRMIRRRSLCI